jgi:nucleotide-binding universal stress UspA family protein
MHGLYFARSMNAKVTVITVEPPSHVLNAPGIHRARYCGEAILKQATEDARVLGIDCEIVHSRHAHEHEAIIQAAHERSCDLIIMASHGRTGLSALLLGSVTSKVLANSKVPVVVYRSIWPVDRAN